MSTAIKEGTGDEEFYKPAAGEEKSRWSELVSNKHEKREIIKPPARADIRAALVYRMFPEAVEIYPGKWTVPCPGAALHTLAPGVFRHGDCNVWQAAAGDQANEGQLVLACSHNACDNAVADAKKKLYSALYMLEMQAAGLWKPAMAAGMRSKAKLPRSRQVLDLRARVAGGDDAKAAGKLAALAAAAEACEPLASNVDPGMSLADQSRAMLAALYAPSDLIWYGDLVPVDGQPKFIGQPVEAGYIMGLLEGGIPGRTFICMSRLLAGSDRRLNENVESTPWLVLEADTPRGDMPADEWARRLATALIDAGLPPRLMVDSGGKSIHVWVPRKSYLDRYAAGISDQTRNKQHKDLLGVDPATLKISQPVRLAGGFGTGRKRPATLLYLQP